MPIAMATISNGVPYYQVEVLIENRTRADITSMTFASLVSMQSYVN